MNATLAAALEALLDRTLVLGSREFGGYADLVTTLLTTRGAGRHRYEAVSTYTSHELIFAQCRSCSPNVVALCKVECELSRTLPYFWSNRSHGSHVLVAYNIDQISVCSSRNPLLQ